IPASKENEFIEAVKEVIPNFTVGTPDNEKSALGPLISKKQFDRVQGYIQKGMDEGATLAVGGPGKPDGLEKGYYVKPTVLTNVKNDKTIAQEEIFGPVMSILTYDTLEEAIEIANDTLYGLTGYVIEEDSRTLIKGASSIREVRIEANKAPSDIAALFSGYKKTGNGRDWKDYGIEEYLEVKTVLEV